MRSSFFLLLRRAAAGNGATQKVEKTIAGHEVSIHLPVQLGLFGDEIP